MKFFKFLLVVLFLLPQKDVFSQSNLSKENKSIADNFIRNNDYLVVNPQFIAEKDRLIFKEYRKLNITEIEKLKISFPKYLVVDTKTKPGKAIKQAINTETVFTDLQFDFTGAPFVVFMDSEKTINNKFFYQNFRFADLIVAKYITEKTNEIFFICKLNSNFSEGNITYGIFAESDLDAISKQKNYDFVVKGNEDRILEDTKANSKKYLNGYFSNIFPNDQIYLYDVVYDVNILGSDKKVKFLTTAISNTKENKLNLTDFYSSEVHKPIEFKFKSTVNIHKLLTNPIIIDSIRGIKDIQTSEFRYWEEGDQDIRINSEAKLMRKDLNNFSRFNLAYFTNKFKDSSFFQKIVKNPYVLKTNLNETGSVMGFEFNEYIQNGNYRIDHGANLSVVKNDTKVEFNYSPQKMGNYSYSYDEYNFSPKSITKEFDTRLDSLNFKFVFVDPLLLMQVNYNRENYHFQKDINNLIDFNAKNCSRVLQEYYGFLKSNNKQKLTDDKNKEVLYSKYGKKYVDLALEGNMVVGMPEDLLVLTMNLWQITRRTNFQNGYGWDCYSKLNKSKKLTLRVHNKKISYLSYY